MTLNLSEKTRQLPSDLGGFAVLPVFRVLASANGLLREVLDPGMCELVSSIVQGASITPRGEPVVECSIDNFTKRAIAIGSGAHLKKIGEQVLHRVVDVMAYIYSIKPGLLV